ncbi:hypothetical protein D3C81_2040670 [compost metagenome]
MNTIQQLSGAMGTAIIVTVMSAGQRNYTAGQTSSAGVNDAASAMAAGVDNGFMLALLFAAAAFVVAIFIRRSRHSA